MGKIPHCPRMCRGEECDGEECEEEVGINYVHGMVKCRNGLHTSQASVGVCLL